MKKRTFNQTLFFILFCLFVANGIFSSAQTAGSYAFVASSGTYTSLPGGATNVNEIEVDDAYATGIPIGFTFTYCGTGYTTVSVSSNGWLSFQTAATSALTNDLDNDASGIRPLLAPLWDDLDGGGGTAKYETTGVVGSRIFTMQWENWWWNYTATSAVISFQVKLYEADNHIEFVYRQDAAAVVSGSASIGICDASLGATHFLSLDGTGTSPGVSSTTETTTLSAKPATGQIYRFNPGSPMAYSSCTTTQTVTSGVYTGTINNQVIGVEVVTTGSTSPLTINSLTFNTTGTSNPAVDIQNAKLFSTGTSNVFSTTTQVGATVAAPSGSFTISPGTALQGGTNYFWLTYDVTSGATPGNVIDAQCSQIQVASVNRTPSVTSPAGTRTITLTPAFNGTFEGGGSFIANGMTEVNGTQTNKWVVGTVTDNGGSYSAYISQDAGVNNTYNVSSTSVSHFYFDYTFPASAPIINLSFDWHNYGESCCDYLLLYVVPTSTTPVEGTLLASGQVSANLNVQSAWQTSTYTLDPAFAGTTQRIVFSWRNDGSLGTDPPAAVDNIIITTSDNDDCADATVLPVNSGSCSYSTYGNSFATSSGVANGACGDNDVLDVWFRVTVPASGNLVFQADAIDFNDGAMAIYSGNCGSLTEIACDDDNGPGIMPRIEASGLTPGATIFIRFWEVSGLQSGDFSICVFEPAQILAVDAATYTPTELVQDVLITGCLTASNITYTGAAAGIGYFDGTGAPSITFQDGVILGSGSVDGGEGPNNSDSYSLDNLVGGDADLNALSGGTTQDASILEFDFVPSSNNVQFNFLFASEEYNEFAGGSYNDVFGFFISGPGISGPYTNSAVNIALIPGTSTPVAINNVNATTNSAYYVNNDYGDISPLNNQVQFDGYTVPLTAEATLVACQTYHIKLAVADVADGVFDSWVLLEANSFTSGNGAVLNVVNATGTTDSYEGCQSNIVFSRVDPSQTADPISFSYSVSGTATYNTDYTIPGYPNATIPAGSASVSIPISAILDGAPEAAETIIISLTGGCPCNPTVQTSTINLHDFTTVTGEITSAPTSICLGSSTTLTSAVYTGNYVGYFWYNGATLIGTTQNITVTPLTTTNYTLTLRDSCGNSVNDNVLITVNTPSTAATSITATPATICNGSSSTLAVSGGALGTGAVWRWYTTSCGGTLAGTGSSLSVSPTSTTTYWVRAEGACGNTTCVSTTVTVNPRPTLYNVGGTGSYCTGGTGVAVTLSGSQSGVNYALYQSGTPTGTTVAGTGGAISFGNQLAGNYTVVATNATTGCTSTMTGTAVITTNPLPTAYNVTGTGSYCSGGTGVAVGLSGSQSGVNYALYISGTPTGTTVAGTGGAISFGNQTAGVYTVVATNTTTGCTNNMTGSATVTANPLPTAYNVTGTGSYCSGGTGVAVGLSGSQSGVSYALYLGGAPTGTTAAGTGGAISFGNQTAGTYTVVATNATTGCTNTMTGSAIVTANPLPTAYNVTGTGSYCQGTSGVAVGLSGSQSGVNYTLYLGGVATGTTLSGTGGALNFGNQTAGTYTVVATNTATLCTNNMTGSAVVTMNTLPSVTASAAPTSIPNGGTSSLSCTPSGSYTYSWSPAGSVVSPSAQNTSTTALGATTTFTVTVTNSTTGCSSTGTVTVTVTGGALSATASASPGTTICSGSSVVITANPSGGSGSYTYLWSAGPSVTSQSQTVSPVANTTYTVTVTDAVTMGTVVASVTITVNPLPTLYNVTGTDSYCAGTSGSPIGLSDSDLGFSYQLIKNGTPTAITLAGTGIALNFGNQLNGIYTVIATNNTTLCSVQMTGSATITIDPLPTQYNVLGSGSYCAGSGGLPVTMGNSTSGVNYALYNGGVYTGTTVAGTGSGITFGNQTAGTYTVVATNATTGCVNNMAGTVTITEDPLPVAYNVTGTGAYCTGTSGVAVGVADSDLGITYNLYLGGTPTGTSLNGTGSALSFGLLTAGTYTVVAVDDATGCIRNMNGSAVVTVNALPTVSFTGLEASYCTGTATDLFTGNHAPSGTFTISSGGTLVDNANGTATFTPLTGSYNITYTYTDGNGCTNTQVQSTIVNALPVVSFSGLSSPYCQGDATDNLTGSPSGSGVFTGTGITDNGNGTAVFNPSVPGSYNITFTYTDGNGCVNNQAQNVVVNALPVVTFATLDAEYCHNEPVVTLTGNNAPLGTFTVSPATTLTDNGNGTASFTPQTGSYSITYTYTSGVGCTNSQTQSTVVHALPVVSISGVNPAYCDESAPFTITGSPTDANGVFTSTSSNLTDNLNGTATYNPTNTGNFSITYTYTDLNGCVNSAIQYTTINNLPPVSFTGLDAGYCFGEPVATLTANQAGGTFTGTGITDNGGGSASFDPSTLGSSTITYSYTDGNGCTSTTTQNTVVNPLPVIDDVTTTQVWDCTAPNGTITITASGGTLPFQYSVNGGLSFYPSNIFTDLNSTNYNIIVVDDEGCSTTTTTSVGNAVGPVIDSIVVSDIACYGGLTGEIIIYSSTGVNYSIDNGATLSPDSLFTGLAAGTYLLIVEDIGKCQVPGSVTLTQPTELTGVINDVENISCNGFNDGSANISVTGGVLPYSFVWDDVATTTDSTVINLSPDQYYHVVVTDANGCVYIDSVILNQPDELVATIASYQDVTCFGYSDGTAIVNVVGGTPLYTINWSVPTEITPTLDGMSANVWYYVTVTDDHGCTDVDSVMLSQPAAIDLSDISSTASTCGDTNGTATVNPIGGTPGYSYLWSSGDVTATADGLIPGTVIVTVTDANSCTATASTTIANEGGGSADISAVNNVLCYSGNTAVIFTEMTGGTAPYTYNWSGGIVHTSSEMTDTLTGLVAGTYFVDVYDANNCFSTDTIIVTQPDQLTDSLEITNVHCNGESTGAAQVFVSGGTLPYSYIWSNGFTGANNLALPAGGYSVTITDGNGCVIGHTNISVLQPPTALTVVVNVNQVIECAGETGSLSAEVSGGSPSYTYVWDAASGSQTTATAINLSTGSYYITVFDSEGCSASATQVLIAPEAMLLVVDEVIIASCIGNDDGGISISVYEGTGAHTYLWSNAATDEDINSLTAGNYFVTITDENGCELIDTIIVGEENISCYDLIIPSAFTPNNDGTNDTWEIGDISSVETVEIEIYNRWGQMIFNFTGTGAEYAEVENQWDGKFNGAEMPHGAYVFILKVNDDEPLNGTVTIIR